MEIECRIVEEVPGVVVGFPSCINNLHCRLYDEGRGVRGLDEMQRQGKTEELLNWTSIVLKKVAVER